MQRLGANFRRGTIGSGGAMLKGIKKIKGLGVYGDYSPPAETAEFGIKNLIYGWNYSGKTTLSRLFAHLERGDYDPDITGYSFLFETDTGNVTEANAKMCGHVVRVFNTDFIHANLNFSGSPSRPILLLGSESEETQKEIARLTEMRGRVSQAIANQQKAAKTDADALADAKKTAAATTKAALSLTEIYTATQMAPDIQIVSLGIKDYKLTPEQLEADTKLARTSDQDALPPVAKVNAKSELAEIWEQAGPLLSKTPEVANAIQYLTENPSVANWVERGLDLHEHKEHCEFCGNKLAVERLDALRAHFSKAQTDFKSKLQAFLTAISGARLDFIEFNPRQVSAQFRDGFSAANEAGKKAADMHDAALATLVAEVEAKIASPFVSRTRPKMPDRVVDTWIQAAAEIDAVITEHNKVADHFDAEKADAIKRARWHYAQEFAEQQKIDERAKKQTLWKTRVQNLQKLGDAIDKDKLDLEAKISQAQKGREAINRRIETLLGSDSVQIAVTKFNGEERFKLMRRDGSIAKHLSEGEKTAIAFSFFLTKLQEIKEFDKAIVFIDDPISSLDSNHIFQVNAIIREAFFEQAPGTGEWKARCKQVFLSTHNFEFFSLLREIGPTKQTKVRNYLVRRLSPTSSTFMNMPDSMAKYASEYHFLFAVLDEFHKAPDKTDFKVLMHVPNAVRRFVELYTYAKYPDGSVDTRFDRLFGPGKSKRILKVLHYFSHGNNIERIAANNDLMCDIEGAVQDLISLIAAEDPLHLEALRAAQ
jgi:wobble nucleotide-excising tRNase